MKSEPSGRSHEGAPSRVLEESPACARGVEMVFTGYDMCLCDPTIHDSSLLAMGRKIYYALKARGLNVQQHLVDEGLEPATMDIQGVVKK